MSRSIGSVRDEPFRPALPRLDVVGNIAVLTDVRGQRWSVADARKGEAPSVYRVPPDPDATHRVFRRNDGLGAVADLGYTRPVLLYHGVDDGSASAMHIALEHALNRTPRARERLAC